MPATLYTTGAVLKTYTPGDDASSPDDIWNSLAESVSRIFDRECEVPDGFFGVAPGAGSETVKNLRTNGTEFLNIGPYIPSSITAFTVDGVNRLNDTTYFERDGFIVFDTGSQDNIPETNLTAVVTARFGFSAIPVDIVQACIEQALFMWRRKDLSFTDLSGVSSAAIIASFSPTFLAVAKRYRGLYGQNSYFG